MSVASINQYLLSDMLESGWPHITVYLADVPDTQVTIPANVSRPVVKESRPAHFAVFPKTKTLQSGCGRR